MSKNNCEKKLEKENVCTCEDCACECQKEDKNEYLEMAQRIQAEFDNYRKRSSDIVRTARNDGIIDAVTRFLPSLDAIKKAKQMITDEKTLEGIELIDKEFTNSLKALGIEEIEALGQHFNPSFHNVIAVKTDNSLEDGTITDVFQAGYKIGDRVIRYSQVIINKIENKKEI
ncbi:MAG: nucleotide exchange factor GrpE [Firmicutes bacterium]|nr:nucleotide exchange factor GrpE [Bacillota bacterium]MDY3658867.1 nucleotide exchange factor GrpE [Eubacteriales bacterium]